ncbi:MAG TPA: antibiotic biosynthesis monooxygenase [Gemmatimonadales bacterium]|nr:antibiotic biosynthesis monooxygenase [Gemmatimonadales bacterium]
MYWVVWSYDVKPEQVRAFERAYGPDGDWVRLFRRAPGYAGTELRRETDRAAHYLTIDRWNTRADYRRFRDAFRSEYALLDARCGALTDSEKRVGDFETTASEIAGGKS